MNRMCIAPLCEEPVFESSMCLVHYRDFLSSVIKRVAKEKARLDEAFEQFQTRG